VVAHPAFARSEHPVRAERARGSAFRSSARTTNEVRGTGSRRGLARRKGSANLHSIWSGPRKARLFGGALCEARQPVSSPRGGGRRQRRGKGRHLSLQNEESKQLAVGARASSYCRSRQNVLGFREARHLWRSGRKPARHSGAREREPDHRRSLRRASAGAHRWQKGGGSSQARRSSSRERRVFDEGCAVSFVLRRGRDARRVCRWKAPWVGKAHAFHEAPAEPILAASEQASGIRRKANPGARHGGGDRGVRGGRPSISHGGRKRHRVNIVRSPK